MRVRARDLRANILAMGFEKGVVHTVELMLEEQVGIRQSLLDMAELQSQMLDQLGQMVEISGSMRKSIDDMRRKDDQYDAVTSEDPRTPPN